MLLNEPTPDEKRFLQPKFLIIVSSVIVVAGVFAAIFLLIDQPAVSPNWQSADFTELVQKCVKKTGQLGTTYSDLTKEYCECSTKKIQATFTKQQYIDILNKEPAEQSKLLTPLLQDCMGTYQDTINVLINQ
jgi:hypothetical protein